jgi:hypothetical protein
VRRANLQLPAAVVPPLGIRESFRNQDQSPFDLKEIPAAGLSVPPELRFALPDSLCVEPMPGNHEILFTNPSGPAEKIAEAGRK